MNIIAEPLTLDLEPAEIWSFKNPKRGDHIRVRRIDGLYYHHSIFVSAEEATKFTFTTCA